MIMNLLINTLLNRKQRLSHLLHGHDIWSHCKRERESAYRCERLHANVKGRDEERERERERETVSAFSLEINIYPKSKKRGQKDEIRDTYTGERERERERGREKESCALHPSFEG